MHESRWMKQTSAKIRIGPEYQAVLPDLLSPERRTEDGREAGPGRPGRASSQSVDDDFVASGQNKQGSKNSNNKLPTSEKSSSHVNIISVSESSTKSKSSTKTQKTITKAKTNNKGGSKSSK